MVVRGMAVVAARVVGDGLMVVPMQARGVRVVVRARGVMVTCLRLDLRLRARRRALHGHRQCPANREQQGKQQTEPDARLHSGS